MKKDTPKPVRTCKVEGCGKITTNGKATCSKHRWQEMKEKDPVRYVYFQRRDKAKKRGIQFTITLSEFRDWCEENPTYMLLRGSGKEDLNIDRINVKEGYYKENMQVLTSAQNNKKRIEVDYAKKYNVNTHFENAEGELEEYPF